MVSRLPVLAVCALLTCLPVGAQEGLYSDRLPADATLVRVMNATARPVAPTVATTRFGSLEPWSASPYRPVAADLAILTVAGRRLEIVLRPGAFLTVAVLDDGPLLFEDERHTDPARAQLVLYNLSDRRARLHAAPDLTIIPPVDPGLSDVVAVNAVRALLRVAADDGAGEEAVLEEIELMMRRGASYSFIVLPEGAPAPVLIAEAEIAGD